jgi:hypothetical protein
MPGPRNLSEARELHSKDQETIARLRAQLGHGPPVGGKPVPGKVDTQPVGGPKKIPAGDEPVKKTYPGDNPALPANVPNLAAMSPLQFALCLERCDDRTLLSLLSAETGKGRKTQNASVISRLYKAIKARRKN